MLSITYKTLNIKHISLTWTTDSKIPDSDISLLFLGDVNIDRLCVQADGKELDWVLENFSGIRRCTDSVTVWFGEDARFIVLHLPRDFSK